MQKTNGTKFIGFTASAELTQWLESLAKEQHRSVSNQVSLILETERKNAK